MHKIGLSMYSFWHHNHFSAMNFTLFAGHDTARKLNYAIVKSEEMQNKEMKNVVTQIYL